MAANPQPVAPAEAATLDASNPWLGLASFTEETRAYFYGRDAEVAELVRRVQRKLLTVLFGQSGLGKTSILRAGLVPRLRGQGYCPVYVRIGYGRDTPEPAEQIKAAIRAAARSSGQWTQAGVEVAGESLWEYLHHRDDVLRDGSGAPLLPLLIFDQFEEIFTLAQSDDFGRARAARFIAELADLVENRPPEPLAARFEEDERTAEAFDFARSDYRVLIALREDYLAPLESLKQQMPSVAQNRLRLAPMTGAQALEAVLGPGRGLVSREVAEAIVRFVAGGSEIANAEVEPSLLSLICRELNDARIAQGRAEISLDLLAGSHSTILANFYERALADQPPGVRRVIEDELLTASGFRENIAEERLVAHLTAAGAAPGTLALLVNRRLLRIEERLDARRVELTHDVLCPVVKASRDQRQEREAREAAERQLAEQQERERVAHRALVRARQVAAVCTLLAGVAIAAAVLAYFSGQRAHRAERRAQETEAVAQQARTQAEHLLAYLADDFARELESTGRLDALADFSQRQIDYFHALPPALKSAESTRNAALAMVHHARALRTLGDLTQANANAEEAQGLLEALRRGGDNSEATTLALAAADLIRSQVHDNRGEPDAYASGREALELLKPLIAAPNASLAVRRAYIETLTRLGFQEQKQRAYEDALRSTGEAMTLAAGLGARDLSDPDMGAWYAEAAAWQLPALYNLGRAEEAKRAGEDGFAVAGRVLERRPGHRLALHAQHVLGDALVALALDSFDPREAVRIGRRNEPTARTLLELDPDNVVTLNNLAGSYQIIGAAHWQAGQFHEALASLHTAAETQARAAARTSSPDFALTQLDYNASLAFRQIGIGDSAGADATITRIEAIGARLEHELPAGTAGAKAGEVWALGLKGYAALLRGDAAAGRREATASRHLLEAAPARDKQEQAQKDIVLSQLALLQAMGEFDLGDYAAAADSANVALAARRRAASALTRDVQRDLAEDSTWLAMAQARAGHKAEAAATIAPVVAQRRQFAQRNRSDVWVPLELATALYAQSLSDETNAAALRREAAALLDQAPPDVRALPEVRRWRARIAKPD